MAWTIFFIVYVVLTHSKWVKHNLISYYKLIFPFYAFYNLNHASIKHQLRCHQACLSCPGQKRTQISVLLESYVNRNQFKSFQLLFRIFSCLYLNSIVCPRNESIQCFLRFLSSAGNINRLYFFRSSFWSPGWKKTSTLVLKKKLHSFYQCSCNCLRLFTVHSKHGMFYNYESHPRWLCGSIHIHRSNRNSLNLSNRNYGNYRSFYTDILFNRNHSSISFLLHSFSRNGSIKFRYHMVLCFWFTFGNCGNTNDSSFIRLPIWNSKIFLTASSEK